LDKKEGERPKREAAAAVIGTRARVGTEVDVPWERTEAGEELRWAWRPEWAPVTWEG
jgi:hypothetical protein